MLAPQFSLRSILAAMVVCGFVSLIGAAALRGSPSATAVMIGIAALILILAIHGLQFFVMWAFSLVIPARWLAAPGQSPFATSPARPSAEAREGWSAGQSPFAAVTDKDR